MMNETSSAKVFIFILLSSASLLSPAQVAVELEAMNVVYIGLDNPIQVAVPGYQRSGLRVSATASCSITDRDSVYVLRARHRGDCSVIIKNGNGDTLGIRNLRVRSIPVPEARMGTLESGYYSQGAINAQPGIYATLGEGFAYVGVKYRIDSCVVDIYTPYEHVRCHQQGTAFLTESKRCLNEAIMVKVDEIYVHNDQEGLSRRTRPLHITNKEYVAVPGYSALGNRIPQPGTCLVDTAFGLTLLDTGGSRLIRVSKADPMNYVNLKDGDTLISLINGYYRRYSEEGILIEEGQVGLLHDSIYTREVQGEYPIFFGSESTSDTGINLLLLPRYIPVGEWKVYHRNGKLKARGMFGRDVVRLFQAKGCGTVVYVKKPETLWTQYVVRKGYWEFYDEPGNRVMEIHYPE